MEARELFDKRYGTKDIDLSEFLISGDAAIALMNEFVEQSDDKKNEWEHLKNIQPTKWWLKMGINKK